MKSEDFKNRWAGTYYITCIVFLLACVCWLVFSDFEGIAEDIALSSENLMNTIQCDIDYRDFHYSGLCTEKEEIFNFLYNISED